MDLASIEQAIALAQQRWPRTEWRVKTKEEACSPCPWCGGEDRFVLWQSGYYMCRAAPGHCGREGWLDENEKHTWAKTEIRLRQIEAEQARAKRERRELSSRVAALERMAHCHDHERYHDQAINSEEAMEWFCAQGLWPVTVFDQKLGACSRCPTDRQARPSYTFPIWRKDGPLWSIRHRLIGDDLSTGKYRPHMRNLGRQLVNARYVADWSDYVILLEGTKKVRVCEQHVPQVVGILGKSGFEDRWANWFHPSARLYVGLDPDAAESAERLAHRLAKLGKETYVIDWPDKPDDLYVAGATANEWLSYVKLARKVH